MTSSPLEKLWAWLVLFFITRAQYGLFSTMDQEKILARMIAEQEVTKYELGDWAELDPSAYSR